VGGGFVEQNEKEFAAPAGAASLVRGKRAHVNGFAKMPPLTGLEFLWEWVFYRDVAPMALGFT
jgi:hypothetical protein